MEGFTDNRPNKNPRMKHLFIGALALLVALHGGAAYGQKAKQKQKSAAVNVLANDTRVFKVDPAIDVQGVRFKNRFGIELAGHLYMPKGYEASKRYPAVAVCGPFGAVKEQASGLYAQELAARGFVALAFDPSFTGESGGEVRSVAAPDINTEDFGAAVDYLMRLRNVDVSKIGLVGIGGWGGMAVNEASVDTRVKATVICSFYDRKRRRLLRLQKRRCALRGAAPTEQSAHPRRADGYARGDGRQPGSYRRQRAPLPARLSGLLQVGPRLPQALGELHGRLDKDDAHLLHRLAALLASGRNPRCGAHRPRRKVVHPRHGRGHL